MADVGDVDPEDPVAVIIVLQADGVVEVLGGGRIDGPHQLFPQILPLGLTPAQQPFLGVGLGFRQHLGGEFAGQIVGQANIAEVHDFRRTRGQGPGDGHPALAPAVHLHHTDIPVAGPVGAVEIRECGFHRQEAFPAVVAHQDRATRLEDDGADHFPADPTEDPGDDGLTVLAQTDLDHVPGLGADGVAGMHRGDPTIRQGCLEGAAFFNEDGRVFVAGAGHGPAAGAIFQHQAPGDHPPEDRAGIPGQAGISEGFREFEGRSALGTEASEGGKEAGFNGIGARRSGRDGSHRGRRLAGRRGARRWRLVPLGRWGTHRSLVPLGRWGTRRSLVPLGRGFPRRLIPLGVAPGLAFATPLAIAVPLGPMLLFTPMIPPG